LIATRFSKGTLTRSTLLVFPRLRNSKGNFIRESNRKAMDKKRK
jgi:hypothetical protein